MSEWRLYEDCFTEIFSNVSSTNNKLTVLLKFQSFCSYFVARLSCLCHHKMHLLYKCLLFKLQVIVDLCSNTMYIRTTRRNNSVELHHFPFRCRTVKLLFYNYNTGVLTAYIKKVTLRLLLK